MNTITLPKVFHLVAILTLDDDNEARRERYYQFARPTRSCRLKHSQVSPQVTGIDDSIIGDRSNCIRIRRKVYHHHLGRRILGDGGRRLKRNIKRRMRKRPRLRRWRICNTMQGFISNFH